MPKLLPLPATPSSTHQDPALRLPASKRIAAPTSHRLNSITDPGSSSRRASGASTASEHEQAEQSVASSTPRRRSLASIRLSSQPFAPLRRESGGSKISHPAPPYDWVPEPIEEGHDGRGHVEGEKLRRLRMEDEEDKGGRRAWWKRRRVWVLGLVGVVVLALALGLGIGLSLRRGGSSGQGDGKAAGNHTEAELQFPLGRWRVEASLAQAETGCTSNPEIWRCYPYAIDGAAIFDLTIANTSALYALKSTAGRDAGETGVPANLTVSSSNPFAIPFESQGMSYKAPADDPGAARLEWSFEMTKSVMPASSVLGNGGTAECAFPRTVLKGMLYLHASTSQPADMEDDSLWPYAVEVRQEAHADGEAVVCRGVSGGSVSVPGAAGTCSCVYHNY